MLEELLANDSFKSLLQYAAIGLFVLLGVASTWGKDKHNKNVIEKKKNIDGYAENEITLKEYNRKRAEFYFLCSMMICIGLPIAHYVFKSYCPDLYKIAYVRGSVIVLGPIVVLLFLRLSVGAFFASENGDQ